MKSRTLSGMKPIKPQKCKFDSIDCTPTCKYYKTCVHSLHKQAVRNYHVEIVANSEDQVKDTFKVAYDMLHENAKFKGKFSVTKELITNLATGSEMKYKRICFSSIRI